MTQDEANKVAAVIRTADGGCSSCVSELCRRMTAAGLGFDFTMTGRNVEEVVQPDWSDDPDDGYTQPWPEVVANPAEPVA